MGIRTPVICILFGLVAFKIVGISTELRGDHVCQEEERYFVNVTRFFLRNVTVRSYEWCMQVPPRCSTYSLQLVNDSRTVEEERVKNVVKCCQGYKPDNWKEICVPEYCPDCDHGLCDVIRRQCNCDPGYQGINCSKACDVGSWGKNCENTCNCGDHGICEKITGRCYCPPTQTLNGLRCEPSCSREKPDKECVFQCICFPIKSNSTTPLEDYGVPSEEFMEETEELEDTSSADVKEPTNYHLVKNFGQDYSSQYRKFTQIDYPFVTKSWSSIRRSSTYPFSYFTTDVYREATMHGFETIDEKTANVLSSTTAVPIFTEETSIKLIKLKTIFNITSTTLPTTTLPTTTLSTTTLPTTTLSTTTVPRTTESIDNSEIHLPNKDNTTEFTTTVQVFESDESTNSTKISNSYYDQVPSDDLVIDSRLFITIISAVLFMMMVILVAVVFCVLHKLKEKKRKCEMKIKEVKCGSENGTTVSVTTRSIFHAPLPDPPSFQNPVFSLPFDTNAQPNAIEVVCNMNFPKTNFKQEAAELFYDHPPSTGSYRAASIPEPPTPDVEKNFDPIYDEIPHKMNKAVSPPPSYISDSSTLYMNTR